MKQLAHIERVNITGYGDLPIQEDSARFTPSSIKRDVVKGQNPIHNGYKEQSAEAELTITINHLSDNVQWHQYTTIRDKPISIYFTNNEIHIMKNAYSAEPIQTQKGEISGLTFRAYKSEKL